jgi:hypothetical protein
MHPKKKRRKISLQWGVSMTKWSISSYAACVTIFAVFLSLGAAMACPPCPPDKKYCVHGCGASFCQGNMPEAVPDNCAGLTVTIETKRLKIEKLPDLKNTK